ncbi:hypothetical protein BC826DRAFT_124576 [Russula brevipes]|nr:hypothetical protein BC826DRAFT_124576 [Russula brevipes]
MDYVITRSWNREAYDEAKRLASFARTNVALDAHSYSKDGVSFDTPCRRMANPPPPRSSTIVRTRQSTACHSRWTPPRKGPSPSRASRTSAAPQLVLLREAEAA